MQRIVSALAFTLGFIGVIALSTGWSTPPAIQIEAHDTGSWITLPSNPSHTSFGTLMPDGTYRGVTSGDEEPTSGASSPARIGPPTSFGTQMPDGTYCGVCVPYADGTD